MTYHELKGKWKGSYTFSDNRVNIARGFDHTLFEIEITSIDGNRFSGIVQDDLATGGMEGVGTIVGSINEDTLRFVKQMPVMSLLMNSQGLRKTLPKKHRPIYYTGTISQEGTSVEGTWKFKPGIVWMGLFPMPMVSSKGSWSMQLVENNIQSSHTEFSAD
jgi:hypothetical protein